MFKMGIHFILSLVYLIANFDLPVASVINQPGCQIPSMSVRGPKVVSYISKEPPIFCEGQHWDHKHNKTYQYPRLVVDSGKALIVDPSTLKFYAKRGGVECIYRSFNRSSSISKTQNLDSARPKFSKKIKYLNLTKPNVIESESEEFINVVCGEEKRKSTFYTDYFAFTPLKKDVEERCEKSDKKLKEKHWVNVAMVGLDALSRLNFQRQMPSSYNFLKQMNAVEMLGYNKVGDNTFPNIIPLLTNLTDVQLENTCATKEDPFLDKCPFIWNQYRDKGYRTTLVEDITFYSSTKIKGFHRLPTDYYLRSFLNEAEKSIGHFDRGFNYKQCLGSRLTLSVILDYAHKFINTFHSKKFFGYFWSTTFTHDYMNLPTQGDKIVLNFLKRLRQDQLLNHTILIVFSDHGLRWGKFRETYQGHLEERLPLLMFVFPQWFKARYTNAVENIRKNSHRLTTLFDLHHTLIDLLNLTSIEDDELKIRIRNIDATGQSLFMPVSPYRDCRQANIPQHYCTCHNSVQVLDIHKPKVKAAAAAVATHLNNMLKIEPKCAHLRVKSVRRAMMKKTGQLKASSDNAKAKLLVVVETQPGDGLFESTVAYDGLFNSFSVGDRISRINSYGNQSYCMDNFDLKLYCFCKSEEH